MMITTKKNSKKIHLRLGMVSIGVRDPKTRRLPHSPNSLNSMHWTKRAQWKAAWEEEVGFTWLSIKKDCLVQAKMMPFRRAKAKIFIFTTSPQDMDNCHASLKGIIIDGLVKMKIIEDDKMDKFKYKIIIVPVAKRDAEHVELEVMLNL